MAVRKLRFMGDPVLREKAAPVDGITADIRTLVADMFDTMYAEEGVGLAAPQVGVADRVIVVDPRDEDIEPFALINPEIVHFGDDLERDEEGCLSIPGLKEIVERPATCRVEAINMDGNRITIDADGLLSRILQHEVDHLDGILFLDRVSALKRKLLLKRWQKVKPD
ncbi:MAG TPA: peptide deformylase [Longimicrobiales bacterium]|nr:peptide deformylase [Longimicrobiales bacterium]